MAARVLASIVVVLMCGCAAGESSARPVELRDVQYRPGRSLDVFGPGGTSLPVALVFHGAGLDRSSYEPFAQRLAEQDILVLNVDWTVFPVATGVEDIGCALRYASQMVADWDGDPERITLVAHSTAVAAAGAVAMASSSELSECSSDPGKPPIGLVAISPFQVVGGEVWPRSLLGENPRLRIRLIEGRDDPLVRPGSSEHTLDILTEAGYDTDLRLVEGGHHNIVMVDIGAPTPEGAESTLEAVVEIVRAGQGPRAAVPAGSGPGPR